MKELVFHVWKSCFQHAKNGYLEMRSTWGIFDISIAFLDPENVDFDYYMPYFWHLDHLIMRCVDVGHLGKWRRVWIAHTSGDVITQFRDPHTTMIGFRHADKCWYSAAGTLLFWGLRCSTTILSVGKICIYASQSCTLLMFNGTCVLKMNKNYIYDVTQYVTKYVVTDRFA